MLAYKRGTAIYLEIDSSLWRFCIENASIKQELTTGLWSSGFFSRYPSPSTPYFGVAQFDEDSCGVSCLLWKYSGRATRSHPTKLSKSSRNYATGLF